MRVEAPLVFLLGAGAFAFAFALRGVATEEREIALPDVLGGRLPKLLAPGLHQILDDSHERGRFGSACTSARRIPPGPSLLDYLRFFGFPYVLDGCTGMGARGSIASAFRIAFSAYYWIGHVEERALEEIAAHQAQTQRIKFQSTREYGGCPCHRYLTSCRCGYFLLLPLLEEL
jgi:hypothetical protein